MNEEATRAPADYRTDIDGASTLSQKQTIWQEIAERYGPTMIQACYRDSDEAQWTPGIIHCAADVDDVRWFRDHGAPWDGTFMTRMADETNIEVLDWGLENCAPIDLEPFLCVAVESKRALKWAIANLRTEKLWPSSVLAKAIEYGCANLYVMAQPHCERVFAKGAAEAVNRAYERNDPPQDKLIQILRDQYWDSWTFALCLYAHGAISHDELCARWEITEAREDAYYGAVAARGEVGVLLPVAPTVCLVLARKCLKAGASLDLLDPELICCVLRNDPALLDTIGHAALGHAAKHFDDGTKGMDDPLAKPLAAQIVRRGDVVWLREVCAPLQAKILECAAAHPEAHGNILRWFCAHGEPSAVSLVLASNEHADARRWLGRHGLAAHLPKM